MVDPIPPTSMNLDEIQEQVAQLQNVQNEIDEIRERFVGAFVTRTSTDRSVTVTVGATGEVQRVEFPNTGYRFMSAADLGRTIVETIGKARDEMTKQVMESLAPFLNRQSVLHDGKLGAASIEDILAPWRVAPDADESPVKDWKRS